MDYWSRFSCDQLEWLEKSFTGIGQCLESDASPSCEIRTQRLPRWKSKRKEDQPSFKFADKPFGSQKNSQAKRNNESGVSKQQAQHTIVASTNCDPNKEEEEKVEHFLRTNPEFLRSFVCKFVEPEILNDWSHHPGAEIIPEDHDETALGLSEEHDEAGFLEGADHIPEYEENAEAENSEFLETGELDLTNREMFPETGQALEDELPDEDENGSSAIDEEGGIAIAEIEGPVFPGNKATASTSTEDATLSTYDLCITPILISASTSTTDGLVLTKPLSPHIPNPKVVANLEKLTKIREARARQKACLEAKARRAERDLALAKRKERDEARAAAIAAKKQLQLRGKGRIIAVEDGECTSAKSAAGRVVDEAFMSLIVKFHNTSPKCPVQDYKCDDDDSNFEHGICDYAFSDPLEAFVMADDGTKWLKFNVA